MATDHLQALFDFIPILESETLKGAHSAYITTGEYLPHVRDLQQGLKQSGLADPNIDWLAWAEQARPYLQAPDTILRVDSGTLVKLTSLATFAEKFNKSLFPHLCSSGFMEMLLKRIRKEYCQ